MCRYFSAIVTKDKILWDLDTDSHEDLIEKFKLKDTTKEPDFVRVEILPKDNNIFNHDLKNWELHKDQDLIPGWFDFKASEKEVKKVLKESFEQRFLISRSIDEIKKGRWFLKDGKVGVLKGSSVVKNMRGSSVVQNMCGSSVVQDMRGSSVVKNMCDSSVVKNMCDSSAVQDMRGSSVVKNMRGSSVVQNMCDSSVVQDMRGSSVAISRIKNKIITQNKDFKLEYWERMEGEGNGNEK